jgi:hypothetical protein
MNYIDYIQRNAEEAQMSQNNVFKLVPVVKTLRIILFTFLILYSLIFLATVLFLIISFNSLKLGASHAGFWTWIRTFVGRGLSGPIYFFIAYCLFKLIYLIAHSEPFSPSSPRYTRRIAYAVFFLFLINAVTSAIIEFTAAEIVVSEAIFRILFPGGLIALLLGFGFLVIAGVLEVGVKLQQEQNLTV